MKMSTYGWRRIIALVVAVAMCCSLGVTALASGTDYVDVPNDVWYYEAVMKVTEAGLFKGTDETHFSPDGTLNRAMFVTVMWRYEGKPSGYTPNFEDVAETDYYFNAVGWASAQGLIKGVSENLFGSSQNISREQMATMMYRYATSKNVDMGNAAELSEYTDGSTVSAFAVDAVRWAVGNGLLIADSGKIRPWDDATRAETAVLWAGFMEAYPNTGSAADGKDGADGKSAYELAVENGYEGTVQEWLASLVGADGADGASAYELAVANGYQGTEVEWLRSLAGANGLSAYEIAVKNGYEGTEIEWLASLVGEAGAAGKDGANGASAYELAVANGYQGTLEEWLLTLVGPTGAAGSAGKDGANGKSAYELAQEQGFEGTLAQWLDSLVGAAGAAGKDGEDGKSAYELAVENGFNGSVTEWLASLVGAAGADGKDGKDGAAGKSAYELAVENGYEGTVQQWLASLVGAAGADGKDGTNGKDGVDGEDGKDGADGVSVVNAYINDQMHLILVMSDGAEIDAGYAGVSVEEDTFTVTFMDYDHRILKEENVKKGGNATAPAAPTRDGYTFVGWNRSYTNVTADIVVYALYEENESEAVTYTVKFVDYDGSVIDTQIVEEGENAVAPADPIREGYTFVGWDTDFTNVTSDLVVTAMYELADIPTLIVGNEIAGAGDTRVDVLVALKNNPGLIGLTLVLEYDESVLTATRAGTEEAFEELSYQKPSNYTSGCNLMFYAAEVEDILDGDAFYIRFDVAADAPVGTYPITLTLVQAFSNGNIAEVVHIVNGSITVE